MTVGCLRWALVWASALVSVVALVLVSAMALALVSGLALAYGLRLRLRTLVPTRGWCRWTRWRRASSSSRWCLR